MQTWIRWIGVVIVAAAVSACTQPDHKTDRQPQSSPVERLAEPKATDPLRPRDQVLQEGLPLETGSTAESRNRSGSLTVRGSGQFVKSSDRGPQGLVSAQDGGTTLNFVGTPVQEVVAAILGDTLGLNYVIDPTVQGVITLRTTRPLPRDALVPTLENVLRINGLALINQNGLYRIVPEANALQGTVVPKVSASSESDSAFGVQVVPLAHISAREMAKILEPMARAGTILRVDPTRNLLLLAGTKQERANLLEVIDIFDVDLLAGMSYSVVPLEAASPDAIVQDLETVFGDQAEGPLAGVVRFVPLGRTDSILVITSNPNYLDTARAWIERFDIGGETNERRLYVYKVENGRASDLAAVLDEVLGTGRRTVRRDEHAQIRPGLEPAEISSPYSRRGRPFDRSSSMQHSSGDALQEPPATEALPEEVSEPEVAQSSEPESDYLDVGSSNDAATGTNGVHVAGAGVRGAKIIADETNNALLILATPREYRQVRSALKELDITPLQVLIEATIAEVTLKDELRYGLQWFFRSGRSSATLSTDPLGAVASTFPGFSLVFAQNTNVSVVLDALDAMTDVKVLSSPQLMVLDNRTAELQVGDEVPIATQQVVSTIDPAAPVVNAIDFRDTGVVLRVTPRVNASGMVNLDIEQEVSDVVETTTSGIDSPTIQQRRIKSSVVVRSGETIALGGLIRDSNEKSKSGLPLLSDIPVIGLLFGEESRIQDRTELLVLITPRVVRNQLEANAATEELRQRVQAVIPLYEKTKAPPRSK